MDTKVKVAVLGSNRHAEKKQAAIAMLEAGGHQVWDICAERDRAGDKHSVALIGRSDFVYIVAAGGYAGTGTALKMGAAFALDVPVYASEQIRSDSDFGDFVTGIIAPELLVSFIRTTFAAERPERPPSPQASQP